MAPEIIVQRRVPQYDLLVAVKLGPEAAEALLESSFEREPGFRIEDLPSDSPGTYRRLEIRPSRFWSLHPSVSARLVPSVGGTNVHVRMRVQPFWWGLILVLSALAFLAARWPDTLPETMPALVVLAIIALAAVACGVLQTERIAVSALADEVASRPTGRKPASILQVGIVVAAMVAILAITGVVAYRRHVRNRDGLLAYADIRVGSTREAVIATLGEPDLTLGREALERYGYARVCGKQSTERLDYYGSRESHGVHCAVYLDEEGVVCVERRGPPPPD